MTNQVRLERWALLLTSIGVLTLLAPLNCARHPAAPTAAPDASVVRPLRNERKLYAQTIVLPEAAAPSSCAPVPIWRNRCTEPTFMAIRPAFAEASARS